MKTSFLIIGLALLAIASAAEIEEANLTKNWTTTQNSPWQFQYFMKNQTRINASTTCTPDSLNSSYQTWGTTAEASNLFCLSLYQDRSNATIEPGTNGGGSFPNAALQYYLTKASGNYSANLSFWNSFACGDGMNYTIKLDSTIKCSGTMTTKSETRANCLLGTGLTAGSKIELGLGANLDNSCDAGNFTFMIYEDHTQRLIMQTKDEQTGNNLGGFTLTISNATNTTSYQNVLWFNKTFAEIPVGNITLTVTNGSFLQRAYFIDFEPGGYDPTITAYLLNASDIYAHLVQLIVKDSAQVPVQNALVQIQRLVNGIYTDVGTGLTDGSGSASFFMDALTGYQVVISKAGFQTSTSTLIPASTQYTYQLFSSSGGPGYTGMFTDTTYSLSPQALSSYWINVTAVTTNANNALEYTALRLTLANGTQIFYSNDTTPSGATIASTVNGAGWNNTNITAILQIKRSGFDEFNYTQYYFIYNFTQWDSNASLTGLFNNMASANMSKTTQYSIATLTGLIMATGGWLATGPIGAGFLFIAVESLWAQAGWIDWNLIYLMAIAVMSIIVLQRF